MNHILSDKEEIISQKEKQEKLAEEVVLIVIASVLARDAGVIIIESVCELR